MRLTISLVLTVSLTLLVPLSAEGQSCCEHCSATVMDPVTQCCPERFCRPDERALARARRGRPSAPRETPSTRCPRLDTEAAEDRQIDAAIREHQRAQRLRREGVERRSTSTIRRAFSAYQRAASHYQCYLQRLPDASAGYELRYNLADACYWSEDYDCAAREYAFVRDSINGDEYRLAAARRVAESVQRLLRIAIEEGELEIRQEMPASPQAERLERTRRAAVSGTDSGWAPEPGVMPHLLDRLFAARRAYIRLSRQADPERARLPYQYNNALLLARYGRWEAARPRLRRLYQEQCSSSDVGELAWRALYDIEFTAGNANALAAMSEEVLRRRCTFDQAAMPDCDESANAERAACLARNVSSVLAAAQR